MRNVKIIVRLSPTYSHHCILSYTLLDNRIIQQVISREHSQQLSLAGIFVDHSITLHIYRQVPTKVTPGSRWMMQEVRSSYVDRTSTVSRSDEIFTAEFNVIGIAVSPQVRDESYLKIAFLNGGSDGLTLCECVRIMQHQSYPIKLRQFFAFPFGYQSH